MNLSSAHCTSVLETAEQVAGYPSSLDRAFIELLNAYRPYGGLLRQPHPAAGGLFGFEWYGAFWIPLFQFDRPGPNIAAGPLRIVAELSPALDGWAIASWFVHPTSWLESHSPIECLESRLLDVLAAARAECLVERG